MMSEVVEQARRIGCSAERTSRPLVMSLRCVTLGVIAFLVGVAWTSVNLTWSDSFLGRDLELLLRSEITRYKLLSSRARQSAANARIGQQALKSGPLDAEPLQERKLRRNLEYVNNQRFNQEVGLSSVLSTQPVIPWGCGTTQYHMHLGDVVYERLLNPRSSRKPHEFWSTRYFAADRWWKARETVERLCDRLVFEISRASRTYSRSIRLHRRWQNTISEMLTAYDQSAKDD